MPHHHASPVTGLAPATQWRLQLAARANSAQHDHQLAAIKAEVKVCLQHPHLQAPTPQGQARPTA